MRILLLGSGGREHALALALARTVAPQNLFVAPGNPGIAQVSTLVALDPENGEAVAAWAAAHDIDLVVVGPEAPLVAGVADAVRAAGVPCFGPSAAAARLEGSKSFAKSVMADAGVATAEAVTCTDADQVGAALDRFGAPYVVKDDGLAAGKGVVVTDQRDAALAHARKCLGRRGGAVVVEQYLAGPEVSLFCVCDGARVVPLTPAQDFKRAHEGDAGPNTGGMGAYAPLPWAPADLTRRVVNQVAQPVVDEMARRGTPFVGLLYCGLALTPDGIRVIEFNVRFGDPETQVVAALQGDRLAELLFRAACGDLDPDSVRAAATADRRAAVTVVLANAGYPGALEHPGGQILGVDQAQARPGVHVIHAGTALRDGRLVATGGRVLDVVAVGADIAQARARAYAALGDITLAGGYYRSDIAAEAAGAD